MINHSSSIANAWTIRAPSHSGHEPPLIAGELRLLLAEHLAIVRFVFDELAEERSEDGGEIPSAEEGYEVPESRWDVGGAERFDLIILGERKSEQVGPLSRGVPVG